VGGDRNNWPIGLGIGIGIGLIGGIIAAVAVHSVSSKDSTTLKLRDAQEIIDQCHEKIKEIESGLENRQPV